MSANRIILIGILWAATGGLIAGAQAGWMGFFSVCMVSFGTLGVCVGLEVKKEDSHDDAHR